MARSREELSNAEIAEQLSLLAELLSSQGESIYKVKAYRRAAESIRALPESVSLLLSRGKDLRLIEGVGDSIATTILEIVSTGKLDRLKTFDRQAKPVLLLQADHVYEAIAAMLKRAGIERYTAVGDFRRRVEVISQIELLVEAEQLRTAKKALKEFTSSVPIEIHSAPKSQFGTELVRRTGSVAHLKDLRKHCAKFEGIKTATEAQFYSKCGLDFIAPEMRNGEGEVSLAAKGGLPELIAIEDIRGELHAHTTLSDGAGSIEEMVAAAKDRECEYIGITDHSQSLKIANGVSIPDLRKRLKEIDKLNSRLRGIRILKSAEVDILGDGSLDYPDDLLAELDYTVCSIHSKFAMNRAQQTERILRAMENPHFRILGHATGRKLLKRPGYEIDFEKVAEQAKALGRWVEINSSPDRLDLSYQNAKVAKEAGLQIAISTDAHSTEELQFLRCGIEQARRAGLTKSDILNTRSLQQLQRLFVRV